MTETNVIDLEAERERRKLLKHYNPGFLWDFAEHAAVLFVMALSFGFSIWILSPEGLW